MYTISIIHKKSILIEKLIPCLFRLIWLVSGSVNLISYPFTSLFGIVEKPDKCYEIFWFVSVTDELYLIIFTFYFGKTLVAVELDNCSESEMASGIRLR